MDRRAQAGLEYLMTYGWAIVLVVAVIGVLVLVVGEPLAEPAFSSSDPTKLMIKATGVENGVATIKLQNITGGQIRVETVSNPSGFYDCEVVNVSADNTVVAGGELEIQCNVVPGASQGEVGVEYTDISGILQNTLLSGSSSGPMAAPPTGENTNYLCSDGYDNDGDNLVDCLDSDCVGFTGTGQYPDGLLCEQPEASCADSYDNDGDQGQSGGGIDCDDDDCASFPGCSEICDNGIDDDGDTDIDCFDDDCPVKTFCDPGQTKICWTQSCIDIPCPLNQDCFADLTLDGQVDNTDLSYFMAWWLQACSAGNLWCDGSDLDCSGSVNFVDYANLTGNYGPCS